MLTLSGDLGQLAGDRRKRGRGRASAILKKHEQRLESPLIGRAQQFICDQKRAMGLQQLLAACAGKLSQQHAEIIRGPSRASNEISIHRCRRRKARSAIRAQPTPTRVSPGTAVRTPA